MNNDCENQHNQTYSKGSLFSFLMKHQIDKGSDHTHTSITKPSGAFYIPSDKMETFSNLYKNALIAGEDLHLTEKHRDISPFLIDFDFRWKINENEDYLIRKFNDNDITTIIKSYANHIYEYIDVDTFDIFVLLKSHPVLNKDVIKDGIHIIIPNIVTVPAIQQIIRKLVLKDLKELFDRLMLTNLPEDVIDEAVVSKNNWQMYGSKKPSQEPYKVHKIFSVHKDELVLKFSEKEANLFKDEDLVDILSIRNKFNASKIKFEKVEEIRKEQEKGKKTKKSMANDKSMFQLTKNLRQNTYDDLNTIKQLVQILSPERASNYSDWIRLGWCLRTIDYRLLDVWVSFSKKSNKFKDGECEKLWNYMREDGLSIGTLYMWAKKDDPDAYKMIEKKDMNNLLYTSLNESHYDIASVVHYMYKYDYVCASIKLNQWYEFRNHRWVSCDSGHTLRSKISTCVYREYMAAAAQWAHKASQEVDENAQKSYAEKSKKFSTIALKLKQTNFKENIMKECRELFFMEKFEERLDSGSNLIGFENGVFDLNNMEFREGRPEDFVSFSTKTNYSPYDENSEIAKSINDFLSKVLTKEHIKDYVLRVLSSFLNGGVKEERFHIWTGSGCFGKGTKVLMYNGGFKNIDEIVVGDVVMGDDSTPRNVLKLHNGREKMYRVIIDDNTKPFFVNGGHDLVVLAGNQIHIDYYDQKIKYLLYENKTENAIHFKSEEISFQNMKELSDFLEAIKNNQNIVLPKDVLYMSVESYLKVPLHIRNNFLMYRPSEIDFKKSNEYTNNDAYDLGYDLYKTQSHIPEAIMFSSKEDRLEFLSGVVDNFGNIINDRNEVYIEFTDEQFNSNPNIIRDISWIAQSLGFRVRSLENKNITLKEQNNHLNLRIKKVQNKRHSISLSNVTFSIQPHRIGCYYGFELDGNKRFLLNNLIVVKNSNGKSKTIDLFEQSFGDYCCKLPITLLTGKRAASNAATSEIARTKGKRFACLQEPSEDEKLNVGLMKELTGGDKIQARMIFKEPIEFKPQFKMILTCNTLPNVPSDDGGTWRRIRVVEFTSKFCENPSPDNPNEFQIDKDLSEKFDAWKEMFMSMLIEYYKIYQVKGIIEPDEVLKCTRDYQKNNDNYLEFIEKELERHEDGVLTYTEFLGAFKLWCKEMNLQVPNGKPKEIKNSLKSSLGECVKIGKSDGWRGWRFKPLYLDDDLS